MASPHPIRIFALCDEAWRFLSRRPAVWLALEAVPVSVLLCRVAEARLAGDPVAKNAVLAVMALCAGAQAFQTALAARLARAFRDETAMTLPQAWAGLQPNVLSLALWAGLSAALSYLALMMASDTEWLRSLNHGNLTVERWMSPVGVAQASLGSGVAVGGTLIVLCIALFPLWLFYRLNLMGALLGLDCNLKSAARESFFAMQGQAWSLTRLSLVQGGIGLVGWGMAFAACGWWSIDIASALQQVLCAPFITATYVMYTLAVAPTRPKVF